MSTSVGADTVACYRQQSKKCAQTVTAPPPKEKAKLSLPPQFRFFESESNDTCLVLPDSEWQEGFVTYFKSYQEVVWLLDLVVYDDVK